MNRTAQIYPFFASLAGLCLALGSTGLSLQAEPPARIHARIEENQTFKLVGNTTPRIARAKDEGEASSSQALRMTMHLQMSAQQKEDLTSFLRQLQAHSAVEYHKFLTPEQYGERFGANSGDIAKMTEWLEKQGFSNIQVARSHTFITFAGTAARAETAFHTEIHRYVVNGETHYANSSDPLLPKALSGMVESIRGLHDFKPKPMGLHRSRPHFTSSLTGEHFLTPDDIATMYDIQPLYSAGLDGQGVKIAVVGQSDIQMSDIQAFRAAAGLTPTVPTTILAGTDPGLQSTSGDEGESDLDVEWAGGIARNATILFVTSTDVDTSTSYAIDQNLAPILSTSYGLCEPQLGQTESNTEASEYQQANAQGITVTAAAGDDGAADCDTSYPASMGIAVDEPASLPYVTGVGGTTLTEGSATYWNATNDSYGGSAISYIPEVTWNDSDATNGLEASGGGASIYNSKPSWQVGTGVPADGARDVPDIAFAASPNHDGYLICSGGECVSGFRDSASNLDVIGGTSASSPVFAGIVALLVEGLGPQGNINPNLYALAASSTDIYHDVTVGNNVVTCRAGTPNCTGGSFGYSAGVGYDQTTGWGSVDATHLVNEWTSNQVSTVTSTNPLGFIPVTPCRLVDTRGQTGAFGGPEMSTAQTREFDLPSGDCNIPSTAVAYALNITVVPNATLGYLSVWASGQGQPLVSTLNSDGRVKANAAIVPAGSNGGIDVYTSDPTQVIIDISGYFVTAGSGSDLQFFPLTPCRIADTRGTTGPFGGPYLSGTVARDFPVLSSGCAIPATAQAYSLNFTVVPHTALGFLAAWPNGEAQPEASILNAPTASVTANAAIIPAGANGDIIAYASNDSDLVIDVNGYFAPAATNGLSFYTLTPCRVVDTRNPSGAVTSQSPPDLIINVPGSGCGTPATAQAYVLNATVVPTEQLGFLALWAYGDAQPEVSTLNADPTTVTSNMAFVPTVTGSIDAYVSNPAYLILDISGYFAP